jgi:hypothetical protein
MIEAKLSDAVTCWEKALGKAQVITDQNLLHTYLTNVSQFAPRIVPAILIPRTKEDVRNIIGIANAYQAPLYPVFTPMGLAPISTSYSRKPTMALSPLRPLAWCRGGGMS